MTPLQGTGASEELSGGAPKSEAKNELMAAKKVSRGAAAAGTGVTGRTIGTGAPPDAGTAGEPEGTGVTCSEA